MRLAAFILENIESILNEWESFARSISPGAKMDKLALRDHAKDILLATARDMMSSQTAAEQSDKSKGDGDAGRTSVRLDDASAVHGIGRVGSGFDLMQVVAEYRAFRASIVRLWRNSAPNPDPHSIDDMVRFNESIDQSLTKAVRSYTQRVDQSRQMFLAILGHDLRNPLNSISMSAELLSRMGARDSESSEVASQIASSTAVITGMVRDLLDFASSGLGAAMPLTPGPMDLPALCREVVEEFQAAHPTCQIRLNGDAAIAGVWDAARLRQVACNLIGNAIQHGHEAGGVDLSVRAEGSQVLLTVRNEGPSIPPEIIATIFDPLVRASTPESQKRRRPGSIGLGLYIVREVVNAHGGAIDVKSSPQAGTVFTVRLPRHSAPA